MNMEEMKFAFQVIQFLLTGAIGVYVWLSNADKVNNDRIVKLESGMEDKIDDHATRMATLEQIVKSEPTHADLSGILSRLSSLETLSESSPTHHDIAKVYETLNSLAMTVNQLVGENRGQSDTLKLILNQITAKGMQ